MSLRGLFLFIITFFSFIFQAESTILLYHLQINQINQTFTQTFTNPFQNFPVFAYFVEGGYITSTQFSVTYDPARTTLSSTQIVINFYTYKPSAFTASEFINIGLLITDEVSKYFSIGILTANISSTVTLTFPNLLLVSNSTANGMLEVYCMSYPIVFTKALDTSANNSLILTITKSSSTYIANTNFAFIYYSRAYVGQKVIATFKMIDESHYAFTIPYQPFAYTPSANNVMFSIRQYDSTTIPFLNCPLTLTYDYFTGVNPQMAFGYNFPAGVVTTFNSDIFFFNYTYTGCPDGQFLYYVQLYVTLPYSCVSCDPTCLQCAPRSQIGQYMTDASSCTACLWLRYLNQSQFGMGNCVCWPGIEQVNGVCQQCQQSCLRFTVAYIQTTNTSNFLLQYSYGTVVQLLDLSQNLQVYINDVQVQFIANQQEDSYYIINLALADMKVCEGINCHIYFIYQYPQYVLIESQTQCLSNNNITVYIDNYIDYYSYVPNQLQQAFDILGITIGMAFSGGYSSLVTILFEVEQLIDAHRYVNLQLPVVFNQLLMNMVYFRFLSILNLLPKSYSSQIQESVPNDLDCVGPSRLLYYENGLNYYKNIITALISVFALLAMNLFIYYALKLMPFKLTKRLAKKISIRKLITIHDTIQQLELPCMYFALEQLHVMILHPNLIWIYILAIFTSAVIIIFPFLIVLYIYNDRENKGKIEIYEDLLQDNSMNHKVTYIYYVFNYYRKIFFAMCLLGALPGLVQIYLLIILNFLHLAFQVYLVVSQVYKSKMKIIIRFTNGSCIIAIEIMILLYNLNDYPKNVMINIGMACLYLTVLSTLMGILDVFVKIGDTCLQQLRSKHQEQQRQAIQKLKIMKEFKNEIKCNIGEQLQERPKDPKEIKFLEDKQLMENTFNKDNNQSQRISVQLSDKSSGEGMDLVFIDDDWAETYPYEAVNFKPKLVKQAGLFVKETVKNKDDQIDLYEIPKQIDKQAKRVNQDRVNKKRNKYQVDGNDEQILRKAAEIRSKEIKPKATSRRIKTKQTKERSQADSLVVTVFQHKRDASQAESESSETISQQQ